jgi:hypothetical protein
MQTANEKNKAESNGSFDVDHTVGAETQSGEAEKDKITFYYNREERLKKLKNIRGEKRKRILANRRIRSLIIIFIDLLIIALVIYLINKPANVYLQKSINEELYELNVTGIRGGKVLIGFTVKNLKVESITLPQSIPVVINIQGKNDEFLTLKKYFEENTVLMSQEATSVVFLVDNNELPSSGKVDVFYKTLSDPIFTRNIRF